MYTILEFQRDDGKYKISQDRRWNAEQPSATLDP